MAEGLGCKAIRVKSPNEFKEAFDTATRLMAEHQEPFADVTAVPATALNQVREVMLIWSAQTAPDAGNGDTDE